MSQNLNDRPERSPVFVVSHVGPSAMVQMLLREISEPPCGQILVGCDPARPEVDIARGQQPAILHLDEFPFYLHDRPRCPGRRVIDESGPWPPVPVDPIVAKHRDIRIAKAEAKRKRKNLKRLKDAGRV